MRRIGLAAVLCMALAANAAAARGPHVRKQLNGASPVLFLPTRGGGHGSHHKSGPRGITVTKQRNSASPALFQRTH